MDKGTWHLLKNEYAWRESDMYSEGAKIVPVIVFMNEYTGETRSFAAKIVEEKGTQFYLDMLNYPYHTTMTPELEQFVAGVEIGVSILILAWMLFLITRK